MGERSVRVVGVGAALPPTVRRNEEWPEEVVAQWRAARTWSPDRQKRAQGEVATAGSQRVLEAMRDLSDDPFQGARERRYLAPDETAAQLDVRAARGALEDAGLDVSDVDFVLGSALATDRLYAPEVCAVHAQLGLRPDCFTLTADAVCNSFQMQLELARGLVQSGRYRTGLLLSASAASRITDPAQPSSVCFGDGATAVVVRPAPQGQGVIAQVHRTDGTLNGAVVCGGPRPAWWEEGPLRTSFPDREAARRMLLSICDVAEEMYAEALEVSGVRPEQIDFFVAHQATAWWRRVVQEHLGLQHARSIDTFPFAGSLSGANLPLCLWHGQREGVLRDGDLVAMYQGGTGATYSFTLLRWSR